MPKSSKGWTIRRRHNIRKTKSKIGDQSINPPIGIKVRALRSMGSVMEYKSVMAKWWLLLAIQLMIDREKSKKIIVYIVSWTSFPMLSINTPENEGLISADKYIDKILKNSRAISAMIDGNWMLLPIGIRRYRGLRIGLLAFMISCEIGFRLSDRVNRSSKYRTRISM